MTFSIASANLETSELLEALGVEVIRSAGSRTLTKDGVVIFQGLPRKARVFLLELHTEMKKG